VYTILARVSDGFALVDDDGQRETVGEAGLAAAVARREPRHPRWVWDDTAWWYPRLLEAGVRVERCVDLRLCHAILRNAVSTAASRLATAPPNAWDVPRPPDRAPAPEALFDFEDGRAEFSEDPVAEYALQREAVDAAADPSALSLLLAAESAGALAAAEMRFAGLPWSAQVHEALLEATLGPRPGHGARPRAMAELAERLRDLLESPELNPDSPPDVLRALRRVGLNVGSTRRWELRTIEHPVIAPLLEYKKLARLLSASGWQWLEANVRHGRFHPEYVPGGVVTGRWASTGGGGALQLPKQIRGAVIADPGWKLVVADASQLEPRVLAALSGDRSMARAGAGQDMYAGIVASGAVADRDQAKVAMLGAMYGATTGESGRLMPKLAAAYPSAIALVEEAAREGERGGVVSTRLGRSSPRPGAAWRDSLAGAYGVEAGDAEASTARGQARSWGRFTRNFVVQGSAAEWALCWMAGLRNALFSLAGGAPAPAGPHLVFFMHDELVVHAPAGQTDAVVSAIQRTATEAGRLMFGATPVEFPLTIAVVDRYGDAK
jgi:DNA polymerase-1